MLTDDQKHRFLDLYAQGKDRTAAASELGLTARPFRALCNPKSPNYDAWFAEQYAELEEEHRESRLGLLHAAAFERALTSSDRLAEKYLVALDPRWEKLFKPANFHAHLNVEQLAVLLPGVSDETLNRMIEEAENAKKTVLKQLEPAQPDIEAA